MADDFDDINSNSYNGKYPAKKQKKHKYQEGYQDKAGDTVVHTYSKPEKKFDDKTDLNSEEYEKILSKINNYALVDFDIRLHVEKKEKQKFKTGTRNAFLKFIATEHTDELKAKGFSDRDIKKMKEKAEIDNGYSIHHKFPRYFAEAMGINYNDFNNLILVKEKDEHGDDYIHAYMDKQIREAVTEAKKSVRTVHDEISFGKYLKNSSTTIKMTIPWPVGAVYLTPEQQKEYERITANKEDRIDFSKKAVLEKAESEMSVVSANYAARRSDPEMQPHLKMAHIAASESSTSQKSADELRTSMIMRSKSGRSA